MEKTCESIKKSLLMVEDDMNLLKLNTEVLKRNNFIVYPAQNLKKARMILEEVENIDLAVLDVMLPDGNGLDFATEIKAKINCPILMLTSKNQYDDIVEGINSDADIYMTKPYLITELIARIDGLLKKQKNDVEKDIVKGKLKICIKTRQALLNGIDLALTPKDYTLLMLLARHENEVISQEKLYQTVWLQPLENDTIALRSAVKRLRKKLIGSEYTITSSRNAGYMFEKI